MAKHSQIVVQTTKALTKKGKLKGKNKKETKVLRAMCPHHKINKHGKLKPTIWITKGDDGIAYSICTLCNKKFPAHFFSDDEIADIVENMELLNNQNKFSAVATNAGDDTVKFFAQEGVILSKYKKLSKKTRNLAKKQSSIYKKRKKDKNQGSFKYGSWSTNNKKNY